MLSKTFQYNGATVTVKRATVRSNLREHFVFRAFNIDPDTNEMELLELQTFANFMTLAEVKGSLGFDLPQLPASPDEIKAAFEQFMNMDAAFYDQFIAVAREVNAPAAAEDVTPEALEKKG